MILNSIDRKVNAIDILEYFSFAVIALNLLWAFFADSFLTNFFFIACILSFGVMAIKSAGNMRRQIEVSTVTLYAAIVFWSLIMILVYGIFYSTHSQTNFLFVTADSYSIFFIRVLVAIIPCVSFANRNTLILGKIFKIIIFIVLIVSVFYIARAVAVNPNALRERAIMENSEFENILQYTPAYAMIYSYALLVPFFLHKCIFTVGKTKWFYIACTVMLAYIVIVAQYATALILSIIGAFVYLLFVCKNQTRFLVCVLGIAVLYIMIFMDGGADIFHWLADRVPGTWSVKLEDMALVLSGKEDSGSVSGRTELYSDSITAFLQSPILGKFWNDTGSIGGHATAIDVLGLTGIFGFIPFVLSIYSNFLRMKRFSTYREMRPVAIACVIEFVILVCTKNIITSMAIFFTYFAFIPLLLNSKESGETKDESNQKSCI